MVLENLVVGWPYVQRASYISKHRPRTVDFLIVDQFLVNAFSTLVSQGGTRNLLNGADCTTKSLSWQHGHVGEMVEWNCVLRQSFACAGHELLVSKLVSMQGLWLGLVEVQLDATPHMAMVCETSVVGWCYVQRAAYISKHRPRTTHSRAGPGPIAGV
jgi:hypothetical protein